MIPTSILLVLAGCTIDNSLNDGKDEGGGFDSSDSFVPPVDTETHDSDTDTGGIVITPDACDSQTFPGGPVAQLDECFSEAPTEGTFTPVVEWDKETFTINPNAADCMMQPIVCSMNDDNGDGSADDDDIPDVVLITFTYSGASGPNTVRALSGADGTELWGNYDVTSVQLTGGAACGDIDNDGFQEVIAPVSSGVAVYDHEGALLWQNTECSGHMDGTSDSPGIADIDHDGNPEIIIGNCILDNDGNKIAAGNHGWGSSSNVGSAGIAVDIDQDGELEVVAGNAIYDIDGNAEWFNGEQDGYPAIGNFDGDDFGEIVVAGDAKMRIQDDDGTVLCSAPIPLSSGSYGGPPTVADFDGDGLAEVGVAANSTYTVFEDDCSTLWQYTGTTDPSSGNTGSSVFDFEGDGVADVVYADEHYVWVFDGRDGTVKMQDPTHTNNTWLEYPTIADINDDGSADIAVCNTPGSWGNMHGVTVFGDADLSWRPGRKIWNQHGYDITNVNDDGSIPKNPDTNWLSYNNFRSGDLTPGEGYSGPDLFPKLLDVCADECGAGKLTVWFAIGNQGYNDVDDAFMVEVWGETDTGARLLYSLPWSSTLVQGTLSDSVELTLTGVPSPLYDLWVDVDYGNDSSLSEVDECHEDNNEDRLGTSLCL